MNITCCMKADETTIMDKTGKIGRKVAEGWVEIEECFSFPVVVRTYLDKQTKQEKMFVSYPQRKTKKGYEDIIAPKDYEVRKAVEECVLSEVANCITKSVRTTSITNVGINLLKSEDNPSLRGIASVTIAGGFVLNGILIRKEKDGLRVLMPQYMTDGVWHDYVSASNNIIKTDIEQEVLHVYKKEMRKNADTPVERFMAMYEERNAQGMFEALKQADLTIGDAFFVNDELSSQKVSFSNDEYNISFQFDNGKDAEEKFTQRISAVITHGEKHSKMTFTKLSAEDEAQAQENYKMAFALWKQSTNQSEVIPKETKQEVLSEQNEPEKENGLQSSAGNAEETYSIKEFWEAYQSGDAQKMMQILATFKMKPQEAIFTKNGNAVKIHSAEYQEGDYTVQLRFVNEWNPVQVIPPEKPVSQEISAYLYEKNQICGIVPLKKLKSKSLKNTAKNYEQLKAEWMKLIHVEAIEFPQSTPDVNVRTYAPPAMSAPRR